MVSDKRGSVRSPDNPVHFPFPPYIDWTDFRSQARPSGILLNQSDSPASVVSESDSPTSPGSAEGSAEKTKTIRQMAARRAKGSRKPMGKTSLLERKDARKMWEEIARELNRKFGTERTSDQCKKKMNYLIEL